MSGLGLVNRDNTPPVLTNVTNTTIVPVGLLAVSHEHNMTQPIPYVVITGLIAIILLIVMLIFSFAEHLATAPARKVKALVSSKKAIIYATPGIFEFRLGGYVYLCTQSSVMRGAPSCDISAQEVDFSEVKINDMYTNPVIDARRPHFRPTEQRTGHSSYESVPDALTVSHYSLATASSLDPMIFHSRARETASPDDYHELVSEFTHRIAQSEPQGQGRSIFDGLGQAGLMRPVLFSGYMDCLDPSAMYTDGLGCSGAGGGVGNRKESVPDGGSPYLSQFWYDLV